jgi:hypothetical protein
MKDFKSFKIDLVSKERWIFVSAKDSHYFTDAFVELVKKYQSLYSGKIKEGQHQMQYIIENDPLKLVFQWDDLFGITIIVPPDINIKEVEKTISNLCNELNM